MQLATTILALAGALGAGTVGGIFFAFSSFVMPALVRLPAREGLAAMQSINVAVLRPSFLGTFLGQALLSLAAVGLAVLQRGEAGALLLGLGGALYLIGTFLVTGARNVPLNNVLAAVEPEAPGAADTWTDYAQRWTRWNHVRTAAALLATLSFCLFLTRHVAS